MRTVWIADLPGALQNPIEGDRELDLEKRTRGSVLRGVFLKGQKSVFGVLALFFVIIYP